jgi:hypothetical protein
MPWSGAASFGLEAEPGVEPGWSAGEVSEGERATLMPEHPRNKTSAAAQIAIHLIIMK